MAITDAALAELRAIARPLQHVDPATDAGELAWLVSAIGGARIVSLGEATHGTSEFFRFKHRVLELLVERQGFTVFGIEGSYADGLPIDHYLQTGEGELEDLLPGLRFWVWDTDEVLAMLRWMRAHNVAHPQSPIRFFGFDIQAPASAVRIAVDFVARFDADLAAGAALDLAALADDLSARDYRLLDERTQKVTAEAAATLREAFDLNAQEWGTEGEPYLLARTAADVIVLVEQQSRSFLDIQARDRAMADIMSIVLDEIVPGQKAVMWGHNFHAGRMESDSEVVTTGEHLSRRYGAEFFALGFAFDEGSFCSREPIGGRVVTFEVGPSDPATLDAGLARLGPERFGFDLREVEPGGALATWLSTRPQTKEIGSLYGGGVPAYVGADPRDRYDALVFCRQAFGTALRPSAQRRAWIADGADAQQLDLSFVADEAGAVAAPWDLFAIPEDGQYVTRVEGSALVIERERAPWDWGFAEVIQEIDARPLAGTRVALSARVSARVASLMDGAKLTLRAFPDGGVMPLALVPPISVAGVLEPPHSEARTVTLCASLDIPEEAVRLVLGVALVGSGSARFEALTWSSEQLIDGSTPIAR